MKMELMRVLQVKLEKPGYEFNFAVEAGGIKPAVAWRLQDTIWHAALEMYYSGDDRHRMLREFIDERPSSFEFRPDIKITVKEVPGVKKIHH